MLFQDLSSLSLGSWIGLFHMDVVAVFFHQLDLLESCLFFGGWGAVGGLLQVGSELKE